MDLSLCGLLVAFPENVVEAAGQYVGLVCALSGRVVASILYACFRVVLFVNISFAF